MIDICRDVSAVPPSDAKVYLAERLTYGDQNAAQVNSLLRRTIVWVKQAIESRGGQMPAEIEMQRLVSSPAYAADFIELVMTFLAKPSDAAHVPIALEVAGFDDVQRLTALPMLATAAKAGDQLAALLRGFASRAVTHPKGLFESANRSLSANSPIRRREVSSAGPPEQLNLTIERSAVGDQIPPAKPHPNERD